MIMSYSNYGFSGIALLDFLARLSVCIIMCTFLSATRLAMCVFVGDSRM
jgi:hypothetical protein